MEQIKKRKDGLDLWQELPELARTKWQNLDPQDVERLKWLGLFLRKRTPGKFMIRVRITGGRTNSYQLKALAKLARGLGNSIMDITTRQQIQLRDVELKSLPTILKSLSEINFNSFQTGGDNTRNVNTCAVSGLTPNELLDAYPEAVRFTEDFLQNKTFTNLPRKCNVTITGCLENCTHSESQDIALVPATKPIGKQRLFGYNVLVGGKMGSGGFREAEPLDLFVPPKHAVSVCKAIVSLFRDYGFRQQRSRARLSFLLEDWGINRFREELLNRLPYSLDTAGRDERKATNSDHLGIQQQKQRGFYYIGCQVPVGRLKAEEVEEIARLAIEYGNGEIRLTTGQNFVLTHIPEKMVGKLLSEPLLQKYSPQPSPLFRKLVSCTGIDYCNLALVETKGIAVWVLEELEKRLGREEKEIAIRWSGCPAGCGSHLSADIGLQGIKARVDGKVLDAVQVYVGGKTGPEARPGQKIMDLIPCDHTLIDFLEMVIRNFSMLSRVERDKKSEKKILMVPVLLEADQELAATQNL